MTACLTYHNTPEMCADRADHEEARIETPIWLRSKALSIRLRVDHLSPIIGLGGFNLGRRPVPDCHRTTQITDRHLFPLFQQFLIRQPNQNLQQAPYGREKGD
jgi:hypothetical protein